jgi:hypothetical protein
MAPCNHEFFAQRPDGEALLANFYGAAHSHLSTTMARNQRSYCRFWVDDGTNSSWSFE